MSVEVWSWTFLVLYVGGMMILGYLGSRRVKSADDFATARGGYGPLFLALAYTSTVASGATFLGIPALAYVDGLPTIWYFFSYPIGVYAGVLICQQIIVRSGNTFGSRTIPEFLGDRFNSDKLRTLAALYSLVLVFYLAGQLVAGIVVFELLLGVNAVWALSLTSAVLLIYVSMGGAHADVMTDAGQAIMMLALAVVVIVLFATGYGVDGGFNGMISRLESLDSSLVATFSPTSPLYSSIWSVLAITLASVLIGLMPHVASKLWALKEEKTRSRFIQYAFAFGMILPAIGLAGILARAVLGDALFADGATPNAAVPVLFLTLFPNWLAAFVCVGVLAAIMSTADGLVISTSQVFSNDLFRRNIAPRYPLFNDPAVLDRWTLIVSRLGTIFAVLLGMVAAWYTRDRNVALLTWIGLGGLSAALAGPMLVGTIWRGVTSTGAMSGFIGGAVSFGVLHAGLIPVGLFSGTILGTVAVWLNVQAPNPFVCTVLADIVSIVLTIIVSLYTTPLSKEHLNRVFFE